MGHMYTENLFVVYLDLNFKWTSCIFMCWIGQPEGEGFSPSYAVRASDAEIENRWQKGSSVPVAAPGVL